MTEPTESPKVFFIGKSADWFRFEQIGPDKMKIEEFWFDDLQRTETVSIDGARMVWKMLVDKGFKNETQPKTIDPATVPAGMAPVSKMKHISTGPGPEDIAQENRANKILSEMKNRAHAAGRILCPKCGGSGKFAGSSNMKCYRCRGKGEIPNAI